MMEVHDCFSITELTVYEDLQISPRGRASEDILSGFYDLKGKMPCQPDGGLKCFGHPIGASGLRMLYEMYNQLFRALAGGEKGEKSQIRPDPQSGRDPGNERVQRSDHRPLTTGIFTAESAENAEKIQKARWLFRKTKNMRNRQSIRRKAEEM